MLVDGTLNVRHKGNLRTSWTPVSFKVKTCERIPITELVSTDIKVKAPKGAKSASVWLTGLTEGRWLAAIDSGTNWQYLEKTDRLRVQVRKGKPTEVKLLNRKDFVVVKSSFSAKGLDETKWAESLNLRFILE